MGGTTIKDYVNAEGKPGYFTQKLLIYQKDTCPIHKKNKVVVHFSTFINCVSIGLPGTF